MQTCWVVECNMEAKNVTDEGVRALVWMIQHGKLMTNVAIVAQENRKI